MRALLIVLVSGVAIAILGFIGFKNDWWAPTPLPAATWGKFSADPVAKFSPDGRTMIIQSDFIYTDPRGKKWLAPKLSKIDGASIPQTFWSVVGGPFEGKYRNASILHDVACVEKKETWNDVHGMFYEACRCGGLGEDSAKLLFIAVYNYGPRWEIREETREFTKSDGKKGFKNVRVPVAVARNVVLPNEDKIKKLKTYIDKNKPGIEELKRLDINTIN